MKVVIIGVGNGGTKIVGSLLNRQLSQVGQRDYHYEPLFWSGINGENNIAQNLEGVLEHINTPLVLNEHYEWNWLEEFLDNLNGLAKFIRMGARVPVLLKDERIKVIWVTRELFSFLGSVETNLSFEKISRVQKAMNRVIKSPEKVKWYLNEIADNLAYHLGIKKSRVSGFHHKTIHYDDYKRISEHYSDYELSSDEHRRPEVESAWWHLSNYSAYSLIGHRNLFHIRYEDLCKNPKETLCKVCEFLEIPFFDDTLLGKVYQAPQRQCRLLPESMQIIDSLAEGLNRQLYPEKYKL